MPVDCFHKKNHLRHSYCKPCMGKRQKVIAEKNRAINLARYDTPEWASMLRTCARCRQVKTHAEFARLPSNASGCHAYCRVCYSAWSAERRARTKGPERDTVSQ